MSAPSSTYRLQLHTGFGFAAAREVSDYLHTLGVGAVYTSPYLQAERGSTHGYNVVDHARLGPELGDEADYLAWTDELRARGLGHILDLVPNHMGIGGGENRWWNDVLEGGMASPYADYFDIEWDPPRPGMRGKLLLPVLGRQFGEALEAGELRVVRAGGAFFVAYDERRLPLAIKSLPQVLVPALARAGLPADDPALAELHSILTAIEHLPGEASTPAAAREARARERDVIKRRLQQVLGECAALAAAVDAALADLVGAAGEPRSFDALEALLDAQVYRLSSWRVAAEEINYRRFFDVNELAAIKMEDPAVFAATHALVLRYVEDGRITGLRLDHTDGLYEPAAYFAALQAACRRAPRPVYLVIEKILAPGEALPAGWEIDGTTGYDFLRVVNELWVAPGAEPRLSGFYRRFTGITADYPEVAHAARMAILRAALSSEVHMLAHRLERIASADRRSRDFTRVSLTRAIVATIAAFPVYRSYVRPDGACTPEDIAHIERAIDRARRRWSDVDGSVFEFLRDLLLLRRPPAEPAARAAVVEFALRFAQLTGPVIAKGVEDTAFYRHHRLVSLNEVGCDPGRFGGGVDEFHAHNQRQRERLPRTMTTTATHDTKRGEDMRARLAVLSEVVEEWRRAVSGWSRMARKYKTVADDELIPTRNDGYLLYQTVVGALPPEAIDGEGALPAEFIDRVAAYMAKATKEAKLRTSWIAPDAGYDAAVQRLVHALLADPRFVAQARALVRKIDTHGAVNGLAQLALKLAAPGVPDIYQGCELWDFSLVDPDNRRPVDFDLRRRLLASLAEVGPAELLRTHHDGRVKLLVTQRGLVDRRERTALYLAGSYEPLAGGRHVVALRRRLGDQRLICVVPRLSYTWTGGRQTWPIGPVWGEQALELDEALELRDLCTGARHAGTRLRLAELFAELPVALLAAGSPA